MVLENIRPGSREALAAEFSAAMGQPVGLRLDTQPGQGDLFDILDAVTLRQRLLVEEGLELDQAITEYRRAAFIGRYHHVADLLENILKEMADLQYVLSGLAATFDLPLDEAFALVHQSNMSKLGDDGRPVKDPATGKVLKGPNYRPPRLRHLAERILAKSRKAQ